MTTEGEEMSNRFDDPTVNAIVDTVVRMTSEFGLNPLDVRNRVGDVQNADDWRQFVSPRG